MSNETVYNFNIKLRQDGVYDLYLNGKWMASRGHCENIAQEFCNVAKTAEALTSNKGKD